MDCTLFLTRILVCFLLSSAIGIERQYRHGMIGLRTNVLVSIGSFMFMCITFGVNTTDEARIAAQIVSGIGFLGAGVILRDGNRVKGLNTAATLWCVAAIGCLTASGMLFEATVGTSLVLLSNILLRFISHKIMEKTTVNKKEKCIIKISCLKSVEYFVRTTLSQALATNNLNLSKLEKEHASKDTVKLKVNVITTRPEVVEDIVNSISANPDVLSIDWSHQKFIEMDNEDIIEELEDDN